MEQLFEADPNFDLMALEEMSYPDLPVISPNEINGILAHIENQPPIAPFSEVNVTPLLNNNSTLQCIGQCKRI